jgi:hypothetical protein
VLFGSWENWVIRVLRHAPVGFYVVSTCDVAFLVENSKNDRYAYADGDAGSHITMLITLEPD